METPRQRSGSRSRTRTGSKLVARSAPPVVTPPPAGEARREARDPAAAKARGPARRLEDLAAENEMLRQEVRVARQAAEITSTLVTDQFAQIERLLHRVQSASALQKAVLTAAEGVAIIAIDPDGLIQLFNSGAERMLGYTAAEVVGKETLEKFHLGEELDRWRAELGRELRRELKGQEIFFEAAARRNAGREEWTFVSKNGHRFPVEFEISPMRDAAGQLTGALCAAMDVSERKRWEAEIFAAKEAAETANRTKSSFLANMSHELRTPLNAIIGYSEMLQEEAEDLEQEDFIPDLQKINAAGKHLLALINDILDLSKIEAGRVELFAEEFDFDDLVRDVVSTVQPLVEKNANQLTVDIPAAIGPVYNDTTRIRQVMFNLLSNACKFTERGQVTLKVRRASEAGREYVDFTVSDTGIGMTPDQAKKVFDAFVQADASTTKKYGGTGLGLPISRKLCEMMGGRIDVESESGAGTTFTARVLVRVDQLKARPAAPARRKPLPAKSADTVLVIDDDPSVHDLISRNLAKEGFTVVSAYNGDEGIALAREVMPLAITLDVIMPNKDGWAVLQELKADEDLVEIPVIMISIIEDKHLGFSLGATEYMTKPVDFDRLSGILDKYRSRGKAGNVLVVEDERDTRELFVRALKKQGWTVAEAENGRQALERVAARRPDVIMLDLMMPVMDGFEFARDLRRKKEYRDIPIVVVTAKELSEEDMLRLRGFVQKILMKGSFNREDLLLEVREAVRKFARMQAEAK